MCRTGIHFFGRLYRACIYLTEDGPWLFLDFHHIVSDGTSTAVFIQDVNDAYELRALNKESYTGYELALDEEKLRRTDRYAVARSWFAGLLPEAGRDMLPDGDVRGRQPEDGTLLLTSDVDLPSVERYLKANELSANAFFNAVFAFVLGRFTGKKEALYTTVYNGRSDSRTSRYVTMMVKTFPVFCHLNASENVRSFVESIGSQLMSSMAHDLYSFAEIAEEYGIASDVLFAY